MRRLGIIITALVLVLGLTQCKKSNDTDPTTEGAKITLVIEDGAKADVNPGNGTVTFKNGDVIYVGSGGNYVGTLTRTSGVFSGNITDPVEGQPLYFYFLGNATPTINNNVFTVSIIDQTTSLPVISCGTSKVNYSSSVSSYSAVLMNKCALAKFNVTNSSSSATCILGFNNKLTISLSNNTFTPSQDGNGVIRLASGNGEKWAILLPQDAIGEGSAYALDGSYKGTHDAVPAIAENDHLTSGIDVTVSTSNSRFVDLGLPSGTLWATYNVGAHIPEEYGDYFAWGETQPKENYDWSTYQYANGTFWLNPQLTKYCNNSSYGYNDFTDNLTILLPEDDVATANWGSDWRMPTNAELEELKNNTTVTWTTEKGVNGYLFTASNGNSLFLPTAGRASYGIMHDAGIYGYYWTSSLYDNISSYAWVCEFTSSYCSTGGNERWCGFSVRPVRSGQNATSYDIEATTNPADGGTIIGAGNYEQGQTCTLAATANSGYVFSNWTENGSVVSTNANYIFTVNANRTLVANFNIDTPPTGAISGKYTINASGNQVYFSQGNLQYQASTDTWRFAENQWDYLGNNGQGGSSQTVDRDLFGWGTSGFNHGANCYRPWSTSETNSDYYAYGQYNYNLYDQSGMADWGRNPIMNGGNQSNQWRTLTKDEWDYIINYRNTPSGVRWVQAKVNNVNGMILLPDDWSTTYYHLNYPNVNSTEWGYNPISATSWSELEQHGAVFLPASGGRWSGGEIGFVTSLYWSSSCYDADQSWVLNFGNSSMIPSYKRNRFLGGAVRLVRDVE